MNRAGLAGRRSRLRPEPEADRLFEHVEIDVGQRPEPDAIAGDGRLCPQVLDRKALSARPMM